jgi:hypothetical protein
VAPVPSVFSDRLELVFDLQQATSSKR